MDFIEELSWRNMLHNVTPGAAERLQSGMARGYIGFDPTAPSMTIGNFVQIMLLKFWQLAGHQPIVLMGGATGRIGDPSGKDKERELKSYEELDTNLKFQQKQAEKFLDFEGDNKAIVVNNLDFYRNMNVLDFLRDVGKTLTVNYMMSKESVKNRLETGISFTEFSYQLLQAYDFQVLYSHHKCEFQMGGSDQWGNITSGTEFIRRNTEGKAYAITTPLLTKSDGKKFGKSEQGNIWLDPEMTSPYQFYQFWINADDADIATFLRYFSLKSRQEIESMEAEHADSPRILKKALAEELTIRVHSKEACDSAQEVSEILFNKKASPESLLKMKEQSLATIGQEIPSYALSREVISQGSSIIDLLADHSNIVNSKGEARRAIANKAISINKVKVDNHERIVTPGDLLCEKYLMVENGKKNKYLITFQ